MLPCNGQGGGVRVTVEMGHRLMARGYRVRVLYRSAPLLTREGLLGFVKDSWRRLEGKDFDWVRTFRGEKQRFELLSSMTFLPQEVVIAVGEKTIQEVFELKEKVVKVRYCHGYDGRPELDAGIWRLPMPTLAVSPSLVASLEECSETRVLAVVPNGLEQQEYYLEDRVRDGVGLIFHRMPIKGPEVATALVASGRSRFPGIPWYAFGTARNARGLAVDEYCQFPSIAKAREFYNRCRVWLVTSRNEGFCLPALEAMACGCAVVSSDHINARTLITDGKNGFVVPYGNIDAYLEKIEMLLSDESLRQGIVREGFETVRRFSWDQAVAAMEDALKTLAEQAMPSQLSGSRSLTHS